MKITNLVISGGAYYGFCIYGALKALNQKDKYKISDIENIYAASIGSVLGCILAMDYDWNTLDDYLIKRPWHQTFPVNLNTVFNAYSNCGIFDKKFVQSIMYPLLLGKHLDPNITLQEFYDATQVKMNFVTTNIETVEQEIFSHTSHPNVLLTDALYLSCCIPVLFRPERYNDVIYLDGGIISNYPIDQCIQDGADPDSIIGIQLQGEKKSHIRTDSLLEFLFCLLNVFVRKILHVQPRNSIKNDIVIHKPALAISGLYESINKQNVREELVQDGSDIVNKFYENSMEVDDDNHDDNEESK